MIVSAAMLLAFCASFPLGLIFAARRHIKEVFSASAD